MALHVAAHEGHAEVVKLLARAPGASIDAPDMAGRTPLHHAAAGGRSAAVMELWACSCNIEPIDALGWTGMPASFRFLQALACERRSFKHVAG